MNKRPAWPDPDFLVGGRTCLDFVNTVHSRNDEPSKERMPDYGRLLDWSLATGGIDRGERTALARRARERPKAAAAAWRRAIALREVIYRLLRAALDRQPPHADDLRAFDAAWRRTQAHRTLAFAGERYRHAWDDALHPDRPLWPVVESADALLRGDGLARVKACEPPGCGWLYYDASKNRSRRWCSMRTCGNVAKARRHYRKTRRNR